MKNLQKELENLDTDQLLVAHRMADVQFEGFPVPESDEEKRLYLVAKNMHRIGYVRGIQGTAILIEQLCIGLEEAGSNKEAMARFCEYIAKKLNEFVLIKEKVTEQ